MYQKRRGSHSRVFSGLRIFSYVPQIVRVAKDCNGASAISYPTWLLWTGANASTAMYAATNLNNVWLAFVSSVYGVCCVVVIVLTMFSDWLNGERKRHESVLSRIGTRATGHWGPLMLGYQI